MVSTIDFGSIGRGSIPREATNKHNNFNNMKKNNKGTEKLLRDLFPELQNIKVIAFTDKDAKFALDAIKAEVFGNDFDKDTTALNKSKNKDKMISLRGSEYERLQNELIEERVYSQQYQKDAQDIYIKYKTKCAEFDKLIKEKEILQNKVNSLKSLIKDIKDTVNSMTEEY